MRIFRTLVTHRELVWVLMLREINGRYRQSLLGIGWALLQAPALTFLGILLRGGEDVLGMYASVLPWTLLNNALLFSTPSIVRNHAIIKKIYFPREVFVLSAVFTSLFDFAAGLLPLIGLMIYYRVAPTVYLAYLPLLLLIQILLASGIGLLTSAIAVFKRDIIYGLPFIIWFWLALTVWVPLERIPEGFRGVYMWNPMLGLTESFKAVLARGSAPELSGILYAAAVSAGILLFCQWVFARLEMRFADVV